MSEKIAIFGGGMSGQAARRLALSLGHEVVLFDESGASQVADHSEFEAADLGQFDQFIFSPGFADSHPWRELVESAGKPCFSEIAFAAKYWKGKIFAITGTNGKSTLTMLLHKTLLQTGRSSVATGNIGYPLADAVLSDANQSDAYAVIEVSSFQAELSAGLHLDALIWTNFAEDHLDRYGSMANYFQAKAKLFSCLKSDGICVVSPQVAHCMSEMRCGFDAHTVAYEEPSLVERLAAESVFRRFPYSENFSLAAELWWLLGEPTEALLDAASQFSLAEHRLSVVAEQGATQFWNDSKATNFHATLAALSAVPRPIIWIGGGRVKGGDVEHFADELSTKIDAAVLYGEVGPRLADSLAGSVRELAVEPRFADAVKVAAQLAEGFPSANVLLSPGFSSFDQFNSYEARGKLFTSTVLSLKDAHAPS